MITKRVKSFFDKAEKAAYIGDYYPYRLGCVAVYNKQHILSVGYNSNKTHPIQSAYNKFRNFNNQNHYCPDKVHAEIHCLSLLKEYVDLDYSRISLYIVRITRDGTKGIARPCIACMNYIKKLGIRKIYYTTEYGYAEENIEKD